MTTHPAPSGRLRLFPASHDHPDAILRLRRHQMQRALRAVRDNLVGNALKYSPAGGTIVVWVARTDDEDTARALLVVQDAGLGIPASDLPHIFERYYRAGNVRGRIAGTGIGLASVRQIVEQHGGEVAVASREGHGTTVTVRLPL
jgi:signal transduction histidine kinase